MSEPLYAPAHPHAPARAPARPASIENAFWRRELQSLGRRWFAPVAGPLVTQPVLLLLAFLLIERVLAPGEDLLPRQIMALLLVAVTHGVCSAMAGWQSGSRVLLEEGRQGTLNDLRLVSLSPWKWLPQKLVFPLYALLLSWSAALPVYWAFVMRGHFLPRELAPAALLALCAGITAFGAALLTPPDEQPAPLRLESRLSAADLAARLAPMALPCWIGMVITRLGWDWLFAFGTRSGEYFRTLTFYQGMLRSDQGMALLLAGYLAGALGAACASANPSGRWAAAAGRSGRLLAIGTAYYLFVGFQWFVLGEGTRIAALLALPAAALVAPMLARRRRGRGEDAVALWELRWLARLTDNPVFLRDLRTALRSGSLIRQHLFRALAIAAALALFGGLLLGRFLPGLFAPGMWATNPLEAILIRLAFPAAVLGFWLAVPALLTLGSRALAHWRVERQGNTLSQLLATPLPAGTIVRGRWAAALLVGTALHLPLLLTFAAGVTYMNRGRGLDTLLFLGLWIGSLGVVLSAGFAGAARAKLERLRDFGSAVSLAVFIFLAEGLGLAFAINGMMAWGLDSINDVMNTYSLLMVPLNAGLTWALYHRSVADVEAARLGDME